MYQRNMLEINPTAKCLHHITQKWRPAFQNPLICFSFKVAVFWHSGSGCWLNCRDGNVEIQHFTKKSLFFMTKQLEQFWGTLFGFHCTLAMKCGEFIHCSNGFFSIFEYSEKHLFCLYTTFSLCFKLTICALFSVTGLFSLFSFSCSFSLSFFCSIVYIHAHNHNVQLLFVGLRGFTCNLKE